jgi:hypothetical protein
MEPLRKMEFIMCICLCGIFVNNNHAICQQVDLILEGFLGLLVLQPSLLSS